MIGNVIADIGLLSGLAAVISGLWLIHPAAALIVGGIIVAATAIFGAPTKRKKRQTTG